MKQMLRVQEHTRKNLLEREKTGLVLRTDQFFKILETYYKNSICYQHFSQTLWSGWSFRNR